MKYYLIIISLFLSELSTFSESIQSTFDIKCSTLSPVDKELVQIIDSEEFSSVLRSLCLTYAPIVNTYYEEPALRRKIVQKFFGDNYEKLVSLCLKKVENIDDSNFPDVGNAILYLGDILAHTEFREKFKQLYFDVRYEGVKDQILVALARLGDSSVEDDILIRLLTGYDFNMSINLYPKSLDSENKAYLMLWDEKRSLYIAALRSIDSPKLKAYIGSFEFDGGKNTGFEISAYLLDKGSLPGSLNKFLLPLSSKEFDLGLIKRLGYLFETYKDVLAQNKVLIEQLIEVLDSENAMVSFTAYSLLKVTLSDVEFAKIVKGQFTQSNISKFEKLIKELN